VVGGVIGAVHWDWLYVNLMWVREDLRGRGFAATRPKIAAPIESAGRSDNLEF